jgi:putative heme transporter
MEVNVRAAAASRLGSRSAPVQQTRGRRLAPTIIKVAVFLVLLRVFGMTAITRGREGFRQLFDVSPGLLAIGLGLEASALVAYSVMTRAAIAKNAPSIPTLLRIQLSTKALTNTIPGGGAAGPALGYRLLTLAGVDASEAGFALATVGLGSAVVLNALLWVTMLITIPVIGYRPAYVITAMIGLVVMALFAAVIASLMRGHQSAERWVRNMASKVKWLNENRMGELVQRLARRLQELLSDRKLLRRLVGWAMLNWLLDAAALWVFLRAFHVTVRPDTLLVAFCLANVAAAIPITPGGLGVVELTLVTVLGFGGVPAAVAWLGVTAYRIVQLVLPIPVGAVCYASLRFGRWRVDKEHNLQDLRAEAKPMRESQASVYDWFETVDRRSVARPGSVDPNQS